MQPNLQKTLRIVYDTSYRRAVLKGSCLRIYYLYYKMHVSYNTSQTSHLDTPLTLFSQFIILVHFSALQMSFNELLNPH